MNQFKFKENRKIDLQNISILDESIKLISISKKYDQDIFREFTKEITRYMIPSPAVEIKETLEFISNSIDGMKEQHDLVLVITSLDGEFLGCVGLHGRGKCHTPELGVWIKKSAHGHRYGRMAVSCLFRWATEHIEFDYAIYPVAKVNIPSRKIPESLGGEVFQEKVVKTISGCELDEVVYKISV